uniref:Uncharacterized protein n=1 Tax=Arundo donax TaxID=35708 RepID=A0A0A9G8T8_ARUDO
MASESLVHLQEIIDGTSLCKPKFGQTKSYIRKLLSHMFLNKKHPKCQLPNSFLVADTTNS